MWSHCQCHFFAGPVENAQTTAPFAVGQRFYENQLHIPANNVGYNTKKQQMVAQLI
jgi:hypothetical protein